MWGLILVLVVTQTGDLVAAAVDVVTHNAGCVWLRRRCGGSYHTGDVVVHSGDVVAHTRDVLVVTHTGDLVAAAGCVVAHTWGCVWLFLKMCWLILGNDVAQTGMRGLIQGM